MVKTKGSFAKKTSRRKQKLYNMKGCSKTRKHLGGSADFSLAYTGDKIPTIPNPNLAYTGKGGSSCGLSASSNIPINTNSANPAYPNTGAPVIPNTIYNNSAQQLGGGCGCGLPMMGGNGGCGPLCSMGFMVGGVRHRQGCKCSKCKKKKMMKGGNSYPNGLVGSPFNPGNIDSWPGVDGVNGNHNFLPNNTYNNDVSRQMVSLGSNPPFTKGGNTKGGNTKGRKKKQKGGTLSNFISQDLINLGRQFHFGLGSAYNALAGYSAPVNPLPWKDQLPLRTPLNLTAL